MPAFTHAGGIVARETASGREYLLVTATRSSEWVFPKGHVESGESPEQAAEREVGEEAGVRAEVVAPVGVSRFHNGRERVSVRWFLMRYLGEVENLEGRDLRWVPFERARQLLGYDDLRAVLASAERVTL